MASPGPSFCLAAGRGACPEKDQHHERGNRGAGRSLGILGRKKLDEFLAGRGGEDTEGDYHGYLSDAAELAKRLEHRGYVIVRAPRDT